jgi:hypothetical protein
MDALSELLRVIRLSGTAFIDADLYAPWAVETPPPSAIAARLAPGAGRIIPYHLVTEGACHVRLKAHAPVELSAGQVIMFPHGDVHVLASMPGLTPLQITTDAVVRLTRPDSIARVRYGGNGARTRLICGFFACDEVLSEQLVARLPRLMHCKIGADSGATLLSRSVQTSRAAAQLGLGAVLGKLSELLFRGRDSRLCCINVSARGLAHRPEGPLRQPWARADLWPPGRPLDSGVARKNRRRLQDCPSGPLRAVHGDGADAVSVPVAPARSSRWTPSHRQGYKAHCRSCRLRIDSGLLPRLQTRVRRFAGPVEARSAYCRASRSPRTLRLSRSDHIESIAPLKDLSKFTAWPVLSGVWPVGDRRFGGRDQRCATTPQSARRFRARRQPLYPVANSPFKCGVAEQQLNRPGDSWSFPDQRWLCAPH